MRACVITILRCVACFSDVIVNADVTSRAPEDTRATLWATNHRLFHVSGVIEPIVAAFKAEVQELLRFDTNQDGKVDESEYYRFRVTNDAAADNDEDTLAAKRARDAAEATVAPEVSESGDGAEPHEMSYFLVTIVTLLKEMSEHGESAATIARLGALPFAARVLAVVENFREPVLMTILELLWNCLEHSYATLGAHVWTCTTARADCTVCVCRSCVSLRLRVRRDR